MSLIQIRELYNKYTDFKTEEEGSQFELSIKYGRQIK
jgi:hypothetical protein